MSKILISPEEKLNLEIKDDNFFLLSELFTDALQGEGVTIGQPSTFMRLAGCHINCEFCDSKDIWKQSKKVSFDYIFKLFEENNLIERFKTYLHHLVITGGSPMLQQKKIISFIEAFIERYNFQPMIQIENDATIMPDEKFFNYKYIDFWNNSPKLSNSLVEKKKRYKPEVIKALARLLDIRNSSYSYFKFVVSSVKDWEEIEEDFLKPGLIKKSQIYLMPEGKNRTELDLNRLLVADIAIMNDVKFCDREQIILYNDKKSV